ncbi:MAG: hypothetical protein GY774_31575 [Planctomycetes bacterium]|nr:hypothetical protein [Planctomycetota bacterium]
MRRYTQQVANLVQQGVESGCFKQSIDPDKTATIVTALIKGSVMRWSIFDFNFKCEDEADVILTFFESALKVPK